MFKLFQIDGAGRKVVSRCDEMTDCNDIMRHTTKPPYFLRGDKETDDFYVGFKIKLCLCHVTIEYEQ